MAKYREQLDDNGEIEAYVETDTGRTRTIPLALGNSDYRAFLKWVTQGNTPDSDPKALDIAKRNKIHEYKREAMGRITLLIPEWDDMEKVKFIASIWNMLGTPNQNQSNAKDIYVFTKGTATAIKLLNTVAEVQNYPVGYDVPDDPNWP